MPRPDFINNTQIKEWDEVIELDKNIPNELKKSSIIKEVCYAGLWLVEELEHLNCPDSLIFRIQFTAGKLSFGRDPWEISEMILLKYKNNELDIEPDIENLSN